MKIIETGKGRLVGFMISLALFSLFALSYSLLNVFEIIEHSAVDFRFFLRAPSEKSEKIYDGVRRSSINKRARSDLIIIGIDENTIREFSDKGIQWPFPWEIHSDFTEYVSSGNPLALFFDINFTDHKAGEMQLAHAMSKAENIFIGYSFENTETDKKYEDTDRRIELVSSLGPSPKQGSLVKEIVPPTPELIAAAKGTGFSNLFPDELDSIVRKMPLILSYKGIYYPNIVLTLVMHYFGITGENLEIRPGEYIKLSNLPAEKMAKPNAKCELLIPIDDLGFMDINYIGGSGSFQSFSYSYFTGGGSMQGNDSLKGKIVMAAAYSVTGIATDLHKSPYGTTFGIEHHANALNTILNQDFLRVLSTGENLLIMLILALLLGFGLPRLSILKSAFITALICLAYLAASYILFDVSGIVTAMVTPVIQICFTFTLIGTYKLTTEQKEKKYIRQTFSKFVSKPVVDELLKCPEKLKLGGEKKVLTVLFSDIRGFTSISEKMQPEVLVEHLNVYFQTMTDIVFATGGTLDKYIGDAIMAFWGAPIELEEHALNACKCAIEQIRALDGLNRQWCSEGKPELNIGIGINTGSMVVGNIGSSSRMDYTLIGDNVNLGSRLEGVNKIYGTGIIISENTYEYVRDMVIVRELDLIRAKGKEKPIKIFELIDLV